MSIPLTLRVIRDEHNALSAMLQSLHLLLRQGPEGDPKRFFATLRAMLFYIDEYPERLHHPKETELLFPRVLRHSPEAAAAVQKLDLDHVHSERAVRELQHLLLAWELLGESRRAAFVDAFGKYINGYREHMLLEETAILPVAENSLSAEDWAEVDAAFAANRDPMTGKYPAEGIYEELFKRIVHDAPAPIGLGG